MINYTEAELLELLEDCRNYITPTVSTHDELSAILGWCDCGYCTHVPNERPVEMETPRGKLVRDRIPDIIRDSGSTPVVEIASAESYPDYLSAKLKEEMSEYLESGDAAELADLIEVCFAAALMHGVSKQELMEITDTKRENRGGFEARLIWMGNHP